MNKEIYKSIPAHIRKRAIEKIGKKTQTIYNAIFYEFGNVPNNLKNELKTEIENEINNLKSIKSKI